MAALSRGWTAVMRGRRWWWTPPVLILVGVIAPRQNFVHADPVEPTVVNYAAAVAPLVCRTLDEDPTVVGVAGLVQVVVAKSGLTLYQAGEIVALSVISECPWHTALLNRIAANYASPKVKSV